MMRVVCCFGPDILTTQGFVPYLMSMSFPMQGVYAVGNFQPSEDWSRSLPIPPILREPPLSSLPNVSQSAISNSHQGKC